MLSKTKVPAGLLVTPARQRTNAALPAGPEEVDVGRSLRQLRNERGLSLRELAERSGLALNTLSLIERGKSSPSVSTLQQLAAALQVPITAFFESSKRQKNVVFTQARQRPRGAFSHGALEDLGLGFAHRGLQPFVITLAANAGSGARPIVHTGYEFVFCLSGRIGYSVEEENFTLEPGDSLLFEAHLPHAWWNVEAEPSQILLLIGLSEAGDRASEPHFARVTGR